MGVGRLEVEPYGFTGPEYGGDEERSWIGMALTLIIALVLMIGAFVWFVIQFDPLTEDFIDGQAPTPTPTAINDEL